MQKLKILQKKCKKATNTKYAKILEIQDTKYVRKKLHTKHATLAKNAKSKECKEGKKGKNAK